MQQCELILVPIILLQWLREMRVLHEGFFSQVIVIFTVTAAGLLLANPPEFGASQIQKAIEAHTAKAIDERNKEWESGPKIFQFKDAGVNSVAVGSSPRFKVYDVDFGWGSPGMLGVDLTTSSMGWFICIQVRVGGGALTWS